MGSINCESIKLSAIINVQMAIMQSNQIKSVRKSVCIYKCQRFAKCKIDRSSTVANKCLWFKFLQTPKQMCSHFCYLLWCNSEVNSIIDLSINIGFSCKKMYHFIM